MKVKAHNDFVILELDGQENDVKTDSGILLPGEGKKITYKSGKVLSTGEKSDLNMIGKTVVVGKHVGIVLSEKLVAVKSEDIVGELEA